jgi:hypothetical protein
MRSKKCSMCGIMFKENLIPMELGVRMPHVKGTAEAKFSLGFSKDKNTCDKCLEPIMETAIMAIRKKVCPSMIDLSIHAKLLKIMWPKAKK